MNIVFMGTPDFAVPSLEIIASSPICNIVAVVSQPDKPKGRGRTLSPTPVKEVAERFSLPILQPVKASDHLFIEAVRKLSPDLIVVVAYGQILKKELLDIPPKGCINLHGSLLPKYRGAAPIQRAVMNGEKITGVSTMLLNEGMDEGDILLKKEIKIEERDTAGTLFDRLKGVGAELLLETIKGLKDNRLEPIPQDSSLATYAPKISKEECLINWGEEGEKITNLIRGLTPFPGAYTFLNGKRVIISSAAKGDRFKGKPGELSVAGKDTLLVATATESLRINMVKPEGKREMSVAEFMAGHHIESGMSFD